MAIIEELRDHWGFHPTGRCFCGCGEVARQGKYFTPGHDAKFATKLLESLRGNLLVVDAINVLSGGIPMHFTIFKDTGGLWWFRLDADKPHRLVASNPLAWGGKCYDKVDCLAIIEAVRDSITAPIYEMDEPVDWNP